MKDLSNLICRAKRKDNGDWVEGYYFPYQDMHFMFTTEAKNSEHFYLMDYAIEVDPKTVGRHTGLTDKNGKKIFEGDMVTYPDGDGGYEYCDITTNIGVVTWATDSACFYATNANTSEFPDTWDCITEIEVIGNIYDTPEILEGDTGKEEEIKRG